jgi:hypothetical protein
MVGQLPDLLPFHHFPPLSTTFHHFPPLSTTFHHFFSVPVEWFTPTIHRKALSGLCAEDGVQLFQAAWLSQAEPVGACFDDIKTMGKP